MTTTIWLLIIGALILLWFLWNRYGGIYTFAQNNPLAVSAAQSVARYGTDIAGLVNAYQSAESEDGSFTSRMGRFFGALPK